MPAYVKIIRKSFYPLVSELRDTSGASDFLQSLKSAAAYSSQFKNEQFIAGDATYVENTFIDVLNKFSSADWTSLSEKFGNLSSSIDLTHNALNRFNSFLGLNIGDSPMYMIQTAFSNKQFLLLIGGLAVPFLAAFTQWINTKLMPQPEDSNNGKVDKDDPAAQMQQSMKTMNIMMPIMSAIFCLSLPAGMGLYWIAGAVIRSIQQIVINKHIDNTDIDAEIAKNTEKYKEKMEKMKTSPQMNMYANMSTRNISSIAKNSPVSSTDMDAKVAHSRKIYEDNNIRKDSLLARANMVKDFNENINKE